ncbi:hypothetical protein FRC10_001428 [Ceratobasidium sp. 414]|nr:hypothetical protein FRC10_001428 [Ceratobasidium sp. 414]
MKAKFEELCLPSAAELEGRVESEAESEGDLEAASEVEPEVGRERMAEVYLVDPRRQTRGLGLTGMDEPIPEVEVPLEAPIAREESIPTASELPAMKEFVAGGRGLFFDVKERVYVEQFPNPRAGAPINDNVVRAPDIDTYMAAAGNLGNPEHFTTAELLLTTGLTAAGHRLPTGPGWRTYEINTQVPNYGKYNSYLFTRDIVDVVCDIMADRGFDGDTHYGPKRYYTDEDRKNRVYGNVWSANWWWRMQLRIPDESATIIPLIIASDKTCLSTMAGGQKAYPVYVTVGNIDKSVRRETSRKATALLAYLPVDEFEQAPTAAEKSRLTHTLTHRAMEKVIEPLRTASKEGVTMLCPDGRFRRRYLIPAGSVADWQEQCMHACVKQSMCLKCLKEHTGRGDNTRAPLRTSRETLEAISGYFESGSLGELDELGLKPWWPWWANLPYVDFHATLMPDLLHQLYQGMIKTHLIAWLKKTIGKRQFDAYFMAMPKAEGMRHFGQAAEDSEKVDSDLTRLTRALIEFTYRAHASRMSDEALDRLDKALEEFHQLKGVLISAGIYEDDSRFDLIAKLHQLSHYTGCTREMGTPDNFSTKGPEHLHIESAKAPWRASNKVRPTVQMVKFMQRYEALRIQRAYVDRFLGSIASARERRESRVVYGEEVDVQTGGGEGPSGYAGRSGTGEKVAGRAEGEEEEREAEAEAAEGEKVRLAGGRRATSDVNGHVVYPNPMLSIALRPTARVRGLDIITKYGATGLIHALHKYLKKHGKRPNFPTAFLPTTHHKYPVWHRLYLYHNPLPFDPEHAKRDVIRARPQGPVLDRAFDVALLRYHEAEFGLHRESNGPAS